MTLTASISGLIDSAYACERKGDIAGAFQLASQSLDEANRLGQYEDLAAARLVVARFHFRLGHYVPACQLAEEVLASSPPDSIYRADALMTLGMCACEANSAGAAESWYRQAADLARQLGNSWLLERALHNLGTGVYLPRGQFDLALASAQESYRIAHASGLDNWLYFPLITISWAAQLSGQRQMARSSLQELLQVTQPDSTSRAYYHYLTACLLLDEGDFEAAQPQLEITFAFAERSGDPGLGAEVRLELSRWRRLAGDLPGAWNWAADAVAHAERVKYPHKLGACLVERSRLAWLRGDLPGAESGFQSAILILDGLEAAFDLANARLLLAGLYQQQKHPQAGEVWQQASAGILAGGYTLLLERERSLVFTLVAANLGSRLPANSAPARALLDMLQRADPLPLSIQTLGKLLVKVGWRLIPPPALAQRRAGELLGLLLLAPDHCLPIEQAAEALCPDQPPERSATILHHATSTLRRLLEPDLPDRRFPSRYLTINDDQLSLNLPPDSVVDFEVFLEACRHADWQPACAQYTGDFLPEYRYAEWSTWQRETLAEQYHQALLKLAQLRQEAGEWSEALRLARQILAMDAWQEGAALIAMRACLALDDLPGAVRIYQKLQGTLQKDLGIQPMAELQELFRSLPAIRR